MIKFHYIKFQYEILFLILFYLFLIFTSKRIWNYLPIFIFFSLLSPPISVVHFDHYFYKEILLTIFIINFIYTIFNLNFFITFFRFYSLTKYIIIFLLFILLSGLIQVFYIYSIENIFYNWKRFFLYLISFVPFAYYIKKDKEKFEHFNSIFHLLSVYTALNLFFFTLLITLFKDKIYGKINENFFAMYFDWSIFLSFFQLLKPNHFIKKILHISFVVILIVLTFKVILIFNADTSKFGIPITFGFVVLLSIFNFKNKKMERFAKYDFYIFFGIFLIFYIALYVILWNIAKNGNSSLMTRFFYWYVILEYFKKNIFSFFFGLGEYQWGNLYKYLTFDWNTFPFINLVDRYFYLHSHAHNDIISFLISGGIGFLMIYLFIIWKVFKNIFYFINFNKYYYIIFAIFVIGIIHGTTEPFAFSPYTGYIFWFISIMFLNLNKKDIVLKKKESSNFQLKKVKDIKTKINKFKFYLIIILISFLTLTLIRLKLKETIYKNYYFELIPQISEIYKFNKIEPSIPQEIIDKNIEILEILKYFSFESETYSFLADYYAYKYYTNKNIQDLKPIQENLCKGFYLNSTIFFYGRMKWLSKIQHIQIEEICPNLKEKIQKYDLYNIL